MLELIKKILSRQLQIDPDGINEDTDIKVDLGVDSLDVVEMLVSIEEETGITVPDDEIVNFKTIGDVVEYLENA